MDEDARKAQLSSALHQTLPADLRERLTQWARQDELISFDPSTGLNGSLADYRTAENLYKADREADALPIVDRVLGIEKFIGEQMPRLTDLLRAHRHSFVLSVTPQAFGSKVGYAIDATRLGPQMIPALIDLRGRCLVVVLNDSRTRTPELFARAVDHAESTATAFPDEPRVLNIAAQLHFIEGDYPLVRNLIDRSLKLDPNYKHTQQTRDMLDRGMQGESYSGMTFRGVEMIQRVLYELPRGRTEAAKKLVLRAGELFEQSLALSEAQSDAWAGMAWVHSTMEGEHSTQLALKAFAIAKQLDPGSQLVKYVEGVLRKTGRLQA